MFYVVLIVCIICIHMITLGSSYKRHKVLTMTRCPDSQSRKYWLGREVRITEQEVMARIEKVRIIMHGRLPRGMSALHREAAIILVGLGIWFDHEISQLKTTGILTNFLV